MKWNKSDNLARVAVREVSSHNVVQLVVIGQMSLIKISVLFNLFCFFEKALAVIFVFYIYIYKLYCKSA